jgi:membrane dipeptidase
MRPHLHHPFLLAGLAALAWFPNGAHGEASAPQAISESARQLAADALIVDTHIDAPTLLLEGWRDLGQSVPDREFDYPRARAGGLDIAFMSIYTSAAEDSNGSARGIANQQIDAIEALVQRHPDKFALLRSPADAERLLAGGRVLLPLGMENGGPIGEDVAQLRFFFDRGVRYITLAHGANNAIADSSYSAQKRWKGLSPFGREVVDEMNRLGIMVDVSHLSDASAAEAIERSRVPVLATHSAFRHFTPGFERNISDELALALAKKGGVIQVPFGSAFISPEMAADTLAYFMAVAKFHRDNDKLAAAGEPRRDLATFNSEWKAKTPPRETEVSAVLDQIDYGVKLLGIDHVGIGSDFDGVDGNLPEGLRTVADFPRLVAGLQARGYSETDIRKILGGNLMRVWQAVEAGSSH